MRSELPRCAAGEGVCVGLSVLFTPRGIALAFSNKREQVRLTKVDDPLAALRLANRQPWPPPKREADLVPYDYYFSHPEHRPRQHPRRRMRRRIIREG